MIRLLCNLTIHLAQAVLDTLDSRRPMLDDPLPDVGEWGDLLDGPGFAWSSLENGNDNSRCQRNAIFTTPKPQVDCFSGLPHAERG